MLTTLTDMGGSEMIVLIEDQATDAKLISRALRKTGFTTPIALFDSGESALAFVDEQCGGGADQTGDAATPTLILLDLKLPGMSGFDILERLKSGERSRRLPVVVFTSSGEASDVDRAYDLGANGYVVKPLDLGGYKAVAEQLGAFWLQHNVPPSARPDA